MLLTSKVDITKNRQDLIKQITPYLPKSSAWENLSGDGLIIDIETTGQSANVNRIVNVGVLPFEDGQIIKSRAADVFVSTPYEPVSWGAVHSYHKKTGLFRELCDFHGVAFDQNLKNAIDANCGSIYGLDKFGINLPPEITESREDNGRLTFITAYDVTGITSERTIREGLPRDMAMQYISELLQEAASTGKVIIGHNLVKFDLYFLAYEIDRYTNSDFVLNENGIIDTGSIVKQSQLSDQCPVINHLYQFFLEINKKFAKGVFWSLDKYCVDWFDLAKKYGVDSSMQHQSAAYDCWVTGCLLTELFSNE